MAKQVPIEPELMTVVLSDMPAAYLSLWRVLDPSLRDRLDAMLRPVLEQLNEAVVFKAVVTDRPYNPHGVQRMTHNNKHRNDKFTILLVDTGEKIEIRGMRTLVEWLAMTESYIRAALGNGVGTFTRVVAHPDTGQSVKVVITQG